MIDVNAYRSEYNAIVNREKDMKKELFFEILRIVKEKGTIDLSIKPQGFLVNDITALTTINDRGRLQLHYRTEKNKEFQFFHSPAISTGAHIDLYEAIIKSI